MTKFKAGDRVRLTGEGWGEAFPPPPANTVTIQDADTTDGGYLFVGIEGWWYEDGPMWGMELNPKTPAEHFEELAQVADQLGISSFESNVRRILNGVADTVASKNLAYGDSALNPIRVFSKSDRMEQLFVRLDDKLSRVQKGYEYPGDDTIRDIIGYCTLVLIARESQ